MFFYSFMPEKFVIPEFSADILELIMERQKTALDIFLEQSEMDPNLINPRACIFWDDYNGKDITFNDVLKDYYYTGRSVFPFPGTLVPIIPFSRPPSLASTPKKTLSFLRGRGVSA